MLTLSYNGYNIPLDSGFSFRLSCVNPACFFDEVPSNKGMGVDISVNEYSRAYFGNPQRFEKYSTGSDRKFPGVEIRFSGMLLMSGTLVITSADNEKYSGWIQSELGVFGEEQRDKLISDMEWDPEGEHTFVNKGYYDDATDDYYCLQVYNGAFWNGKGRETTVPYEYTDEDGEVHKANDTVTFLTQKFRDNFNHVVNKLNLSTKIDVLGENGDGVGCVVSPYLFLRPFLARLFKINTFVIDRNDLIPVGTDITLQKYLLLYNNFNVMGQVFTTEVQEVFSVDNVGEEGGWRYENVITVTQWQMENFLYADLVPHVSIKDFILGFQNYLNYVFLFKPQRKIDIIDRNAIMVGEAFDLDPYFSGNWVKGERKEVTLKFINEFDGEDRMFGQEYHDLTDRSADFGDPVETFDDLDDIAEPVEGELRLVEDENKIYEYKWKVCTSLDILKRETQFDALGWEFVSSGPQPLVYGDSDEIEEIKSCFSTLQYIRNAFFSGDIFNMPCVLQQGNLKKMKGNFVGFTPRLINANQLFHPAGLNWDGDGGLFMTRWEKWARIWKKRVPIEGSFDLPLGVIYYIMNNITRKFRTNQGEFIIETMDTEIGLNMVGITKITGYKI